MARIPVNSASTSTCFGPRISLSTGHVKYSSLRASSSVQEMIAASSKPARGLLLLFVIILVYYFQPLTSSFPRSNIKTHQDQTSHTLIPWASWSAAFEQASSSSWKQPADGILESHEGGPRVRQATMIYDTDKFNSVYERSVDSHIKHGEKWGVPTHILRHDIVDAGFFNKPAFLLGLVIEEMSKPYGQRSDWIVWFDADTLILNPNVPWTLFLPPSDFDDIHILGSQDQNGFNAGMMLLRVHEWTVKALAEVVSLRQLKPEAKYAFFDQGATRWVCERPGYEEHMVYQPHSWWNSFGFGGDLYETDRFLLHFAGVDCCGQPEKKTIVMGRWLDIVENHGEKFAVPLANTTYPAEVNDFWAQLKRARQLMTKATKWQKKTEYTAPDFNTAHSELKELVLRHSDDMKKMSDGISKLEGIIAKVDGQNPAGDKQAEAKIEQAGPPPPETSKT